MDWSPSSTAARRAAYLRSAVQLRAMAERAQDAEARQMLMQLAVLYEELAEYAATSAIRRPADPADPGESREPDAARQGGEPGEPVEGGEPGKPDNG